MYSNQQIIDILISHDIRPSVQRIAVLDYMYKTLNHPTVDEIYLGLHKNIPTLSKTTVYNVLKSFVEAGVIFALNIDDKNIRYDVVTHDHSHFKCEKCQKVFDLPHLEDNPKEINGYIIKRAHTYYWGLCPSCMKEESCMKVNEDTSL